MTTDDLAARYDRCKNESDTFRVLIAEYRAQVAELRRLVRMQEILLAAAGISPAANLRRASHDDHAGRRSAADTIGHDHAAADLADLRRSLERSLAQTTSRP